MLTQKRLREVLHCNPDTGSFTWAKGRRAGNAAGTLHDDRGCLKVAIDVERHLLRRLAWLWMTGAMPRCTIKHVDGNRGNNTWANLREGDRSQKDGRRGPFHEPTGIEGIWGVGTRFEAAIAADGLVLSLGTFATKVEVQEEIRRPSFGRASGRPGPGVGPPEVCMVPLCVNEICPQDYFFCPNA